MKLDELTEPGWKEATNDCCERNKKHGTPESMVPAVVQPQTDVYAAAPAPTTFE
jgi:hypothetical protein